MGSSLEKGLPFAVYRKPEEDMLTAVFQLDASLHTTCDFDDSGFIFAPFSLEEGIVLIHPDEVFQTNIHVEGTPNTKEPFISEAGQEEHIQLVEKGIQAIQSGKLKKVVLSRKIEQNISKTPMTIFKELLGSYPNAFCYLFHHPKVGTWCGATPETLLRIKDGELKTMSLAATLAYEENTPPKWGSKEIEEQQMVSDHISNTLGNLMEALTIEKAESVRAGNLWHLQSEVKGVPRSSTSLSSIINSLHPTPAVCGIPTKAAKEFIVQNENYQRTYYTGFLGELNLFRPNEVSLFVNLRCMELLQDNATIFVGGGITASSVPEQEWIETQNKSKTMLRIL